MANPNEKNAIVDIARQSAKMWEQGSPLREISLFIVKSMESFGGKKPLSHQAGAPCDIGMFHPFNMAAMDVNALRRLCTAIHNIGRRKLRAYMAVLEEGDLFPQEVKTGLWMHYMGLTTCLCGNMTGSALEDWLKPYLTLCVAMCAEGHEVLRMMEPSVAGMPSRKYKVSQRLADSFLRDDVAAYEIERHIEGVRFTKTVVRDMLADEHGRCIVSHLIGEEPAFMESFDAKEMLFYVCANCKDFGKAAALAKSLVGVSPDLIRCEDAFGQTPLDWTLLRLRRLELKDRDLDNCLAQMRTLASVLVELGADPHHRNKYGISYSDVERQLVSREQLWTEWGLDVGKPEWRNMRLRNYRKQRKG